MSKFELHYSLLTSVSPSSVQLLNVDVVAYRMWTPRVSWLTEVDDEDNRTNLAVTLAQVAQAFGTYLEW